MQGIAGDIQGEIFSYPIDYHDLKSLRLVSKQMEEQVERSVTDITAEEEDYIQVSTVMRFTHLQTISSLIVIAPRDIDEVKILASHPTLEEATILIADGGVLEGWVYTFFKLSPYRKGKSCASTGYHDFTFYREDGDIDARSEERTNEYNLHYIRFNDGHVTSDTTFEDYNKEYTEIGKLVPIQELTVFSRVYAIGAISTSCLKRLNIVIGDNFDPTNGSSYGRFIVNNKSIERISVTWPKDHKGYGIANFMGDDRDVLSHEKFPNMKAFIPQDLSGYSLDFLDKSFPNLEEGWFYWDPNRGTSILDFLLKYAQRLKKYQAVYIVVNNLPDDIKASIYDAIPRDMRDKVNFVDSDYLSP